MAMRRCVATRCLWSRCTLWSHSHIALHAQYVVDRGHRLFALCVSWCQSEHLHVTLASSIFMTHVLPGVAWGSEFLSGSPSALRVSVLLELGWPAADRVSAGRLLSLWSPTSPMAVHPRCPIPAKVLQIASGVPGTWHTIRRLCVPFLAHPVLTPLGSPKGLLLAGLVTGSMTECVADLTMTCASAAMLTLVQFPLVIYDNNLRP